MQHHVTVRTRSTPQPTPSAPKTKPQLNSKLNAMASQPPLLYASLLLLLTPLTFLARTTTPISFRETLPDDIRARVTDRCRDEHDQQRFLLCLLRQSLDSFGPVKNESSSLNSSLFSSCKFKSEGGTMWLHRYATPPSAALREILRSYESMHRRCTSSPQFLRAFGQNTTPTDNCRYFVWGTANFGLGNKILSLVSAFLYAILSQRVLLVRFPEWDSLFCAPFPSFVLDLPQFDHNKGGTYYLGFRGMGCGSVHEDRRCGPIRMVNLALHHETAQDEKEFLLCPTGFSRLRNVPVVTSMFSNQFYAAAFFLNPALSDILQILFPDRNSFHVLSRYLLAPSDATWQMIKRQMDADRPPTRRVGLQVREFGDKYTSTFDSAAASCIRQHSAICPAATNMSIYVASLDFRHVESVRRAFTEQGGIHAEWTWQDVDRHEGYDADHMKGAMVDMWTLSAADILVTTGRSTFGYVAHGLAGIVPWQLSESSESCRLGIGYEPCYHFAPRGTTCREEGWSANSSIIFGRSRLVNTCPDFAESGWQLVPP